MSSLPHQLRVCLCILLTAFAATALAADKHAGKTPANAPAWAPAQPEAIQRWQDDALRHVHPLGTGEPQGDRDRLVARRANSRSPNTTISTSSSTRRSSTPTSGSRSPRRRA